MATSYIDIEDLGQVKLFRRRGLKNIRLSINSVGEIRLSIPWYVPRAAGLRYLHSKKDWIKKHRKGMSSEWKDGQRLSGNYILRVYEHTKKKAISVKRDGSLSLYIPTYYKAPKKQATIDKYVKDFLRSEATGQLVPQVIQMAKELDFKIKEVKIRNLKSRWGSCSHKKVITLNTSLLKLPPDLVEYVILHELTHTRHLNHSKNFWNELELLLPDYKDRKKRLRQFNSAGI